MKNRGFTPIILILALTAFVLIAVTSFAGINKAYRLPKPSASPTITNPPSATPTQTPILSNFTCPVGGWVDCMPGTTEKPECSKDAMDWYRINCEDFKGAAY